MSNPYHLPVSGSTPGAGGYYEHSGVAVGDWASSSSEQHHRQQPHASTSTDSKPRLGQYDDDGGDDDDGEDDEEDDDDESYGAGGYESGGGKKGKQRKGSSNGAAAGGGTDDSQLLMSGPGGAGTGEKKKKQTRGSRACTVCRKLKMRCVGAENGPPCKRCESSGRGHECVFEESQRGRRTNRKTDILSKSIKRVEEQLSTVLQAIGQGAMPQAAAATFQHQTDAAVANLMSLTNSSRAHQPIASTSQAVSAPITSMPPPHQHHHHQHQQPQQQQQQHHVSFGQPLPRFTPALPSLSEVPAPAPLPAMANGVPGPHQAVAESLDSMFFKNPSHKGSNSTSSQRSKRGETEENPRLHSLPDNSINPLGLLAEASLQNTRKRSVSILEALERPFNDAPAEEDSSAEGAKRRKLGLANNSYFQPGPMSIFPLRKIVIEQRLPPEILVDKIVSVDEVVELFAIFFRHCHRHTPFLDPELHTPTTTGARSSFLFTAICTVASRYYTKRTDDLYRKCLKAAKKAAWDIMANGFKSIEIVQAFLLLANWNQPSERFEEERSYQFSGIAFRMACDLNLHRKTVATMPEDASPEARLAFQREVANRERTWIFCHIYDRGLANQMGKPYSIPREDYIIRNASTWWQQPTAIPTDVGLCAILEAIRIVGRCSDFLFSDTTSPSGLLSNLDWQPVMHSFLGQLDAWCSTWELRAIDNMTESEKDLRDHSRKFYYSYYRLFLRSFAVQDLLNRRDTLDLPNYCVQSFEDAATIIRIARDHFLPSGTLRYCQDSMYVYMCYAAVFLLKLVSPVFSTIIDEARAMSLVEDMADTFEKCAVDESHTPALYAHFIRILIDNKRNGGRTAPSSRNNTRPSTPNPRGEDAADDATSQFLNQHHRLSTAAAAAGNGTTATSQAMDEPSSGAPGQAFDSAAMDNMLTSGGFWDNILMPGFGGPLVNLSGGTGAMLSSGGDPWSITPLHSRPGSPIPGSHSAAHHNIFSAFETPQQE